MKLNKNQPNLRFKNCLIKLILNFYYTRLRLRSLNKPNTIPANIPNINNINDFTILLTLIINPQMNISQDLLFQLRLMYFG